MCFNFVSCWSWVHFTTSARMKDSRWWNSNKDDTNSGQPRMCMNFVKFAKASCLNFYEYEICASSIHPNVSMTHSQIQQDLVAFFYFDVCKEEMIHTQKSKNCLSFIDFNFINGFVKGLLILLCQIISVEFWTWCYFFHCSLDTKLILVWIWFSLICTPIDGTGSPYRTRLSVLYLHFHSKLLFRLPRLSVHPCVRPLVCPKKVHSLQSYSKM